MEQKSAWLESTLTSMLIAVKRSVTMDVLRYGLIGLTASQKPVVTCTGRARITQHSRSAPAIVLDIELNRTCNLVRPGAMEYPPHRYCTVRLTLLLLRVTFDCVFLFIDLVRQCRVVNLTVLQILWYAAAPRLQENRSQRRTLMLQ